MSHAHPLSHPTSRTAARRYGLAVLAVLSLAGLSACADDDDTMSTAACDAYVDAQGAMFGDPAALGPAYASFADAVPDAIADDARRLAEAAAGLADDPSAMDGPEVSAAGEVIGQAVYDDCETDTSLDVIGTDYAFADIPGEIDAGRVAIRLTNESQTEQPHEVVIAVGVEGQPAEELRELPMDELFQQARPVGVAYVDTPGASGTTLMDLEPGSYLLICSLPVAENGAEPGTDSHADHGMVATLTVT